MFLDLKHLGIGIGEIADRTLIASVTLRRRRYADYTDASIPYFRLQRLWKLHTASGNASVLTLPNAFSSDF